MKERVKCILILLLIQIGQLSAIGESMNRLSSACHCRSRLRKFDPSPIFFVGIEYEIISTAILLSSTDSRRVVVSYKQKYVQEYWLTALSSLPQAKVCARILVNRFVKLAQEKVWLGELTILT